MHRFQQPQTEFPSVYPLDMAPTRNLQVHYNAQSAIMGKVIRVRPNIYVFTCDYCFSEHRTIDNFLRHSEAHFEPRTLFEPNTVLPSNYHAQFTNSVMEQQQQPAEHQQQPVVHQQQPVEHRHNPFGHPPVQMTTNPSSHWPLPLNETNTFSSNTDAIHPNTINLTGMAEETIGPEEINDGLTSNPNDYIEEIFEITDLGFDTNGTYASVENAVVCPVNEQRQSQKKKTKEKKHICTFCGQSRSQNVALQRHMQKIHSHIINKLVTERKSYKCLVCKMKISKTTNTLLDAEMHLKTHMKELNSKKSKNSK